MMQGECCLNIGLFLFLGDIISIVQYFQWNVKGLRNTLVSFLIIILQSRILNSTYGNILKELWFFNNKPIISDINSYSTYWANEKTNRSFELFSDKVLMLKILIFCFTQYFRFTWSLILKTAVTTWLRHSEW